MGESQNYKYYAFISYNHKDSKFAERFQKKIESYKLPNVLRKQNAFLPQFVRPIFRDATDLTGGGDLEKSLNQELIESKFLIVICSPASARSNDENKHWVNKEVQYFTDLSRRENIIPVIVDGEPFAKNIEDECFCPALKSGSGKAELLGVDARVTKKTSFIDLIKRKLGIPDENDKEERAFIHIIARMLGLDFDELWQRHNKLTKQKAYTQISATILVLLFLLTSGFVYWNTQKRTTYKYYVDYVDKNGLPTGIYELTKDQIKPRKEHYRFEYRAGKLRRVVCANSAGIPIEQNHTEKKNQLMIQELEYSEGNGKLTKVNSVNRNGKVLIQFEQKPDLNFCRVNLTNIGIESQGLGSSVTSIKSNIFEQQESKSEIRSYVYKRDINGFITQQIFYKFHNSFEPVKDADGVFGFEYKRNDVGQVIELWYLDEKQKHFSTKNGVAGRLYEYNNQGKIIKTTYVNERREPTYNEQKWMICEANIDNYGNAIEERYINAKGELVLQENGIASFKCKYDTNGNVIQETFYGTNNEIVLTNDGYASFRITYNEKGEPIKIEYLGVTGERILCKERYACQRCKYDIYGNIIEMAFFGVDDNPVYSTQGYSSYKQYFDKYGNLIEYSYFGVNGEAIYSKEAYYKVKLKYDEHGNQTECRYFGLNDEAIYSKDGIAGWIKEFEAGNCIKSSVINTQGELTPDKYGVTSYKYSYDSQGNIIEESFFNKDDKPIIDTSGIAGWKNIYENGNRVECMAFDINHKPIACTNGYAFIRYNYNTRGNIVREAYFDVDNQSVLNKELGYASIERKYNERNEMISEKFYYTNNQPALCSDGYASRIMKYDEKGNLIEESYMNESNELVLTSWGFAKLKFFYDDRNNCIKEEVFDAKEERTENGIGVSSFKYKYDQKDNCICKLFYGTDGNKKLNINGVAEIKTTYGEKGYYIEESCFGLQGEPILNVFGYSGWKNFYDNRGNVIRVQYFGLEGEAVLSTEGISGWTDVFDEKDNLIERSYFGVDSKPIIYTPGGFAKIRNIYNEKGVIIESTFWGIDDKLILTNFGYAKSTIINDLEPNTYIETKYYDENNQEINKIAFISLSSIVPNSIAHKLGIKEEDILLSFNEWNYFYRENQKGWNDLYSLISLTSNLTKDITIYRPSDESIHSFSLSPGQMGILFTDKYSFDAKLARNIEKIKKEYFLKEE